MKVRLDFVTNSSSSSFIIDQNKITSMIGNETTPVVLEDEWVMDLDKNRVFKLLQHIYEVIEKAYNSVVEDFGMTDEAIENFKETLGDKPYSVKYKFIRSKIGPSDAMDKWFRGRYGISADDLDTLSEYIESFKNSWGKYETYDEYLEEMNRTTKYTTYSFPFRIYDYSDTNDCACWEVDEVIDFYESPCKECRFNFNEDMCNNKKAICFGDFGIHSDSGLLCYPAVEKLHELCEYACNHMG